MWVCPIERGLCSVTFRIATTASAWRCGLCKCFRLTKQVWFRLRVLTCRIECRIGGIIVRNIQGVSKMLGQTSAVSFPHQNKEMSSCQYVRKHFVFEIQSPTFVRLQSCRFLSAGTLKNSNGFICNWKWRHTSTPFCVCVSNHSQPARDLRKCATVFDQTCPCVHLFWWKTFWEFVVNCDLVNNNNSAFIKMGTCVVNVLYQLSIKYYMVKVICCWI